jgi:hypothetical protein
MSERIDQLWAQALDAAVPETYTRLSHSQVLKIKQVFADMIVRECIAICKDIDGEDNIDARSGRQDCAVEIKEHFGVEE